MIQNRFPTFSFDFLGLNPLLEFKGSAWAHIMSVFIAVNHLWKLGTQADRLPKVTIWSLELCQNLLKRKLNQFANDKKGQTWIERDMPLEVLLEINDTKGEVCSDWGPNTGFGLQIKRIRYISFCCIFGTDGSWPTLCWSLRWGCSFLKGTTFRLVYPRWASLKVLFYWVVDGFPHF